MVLRKYKITPKTYQFKSWMWDAQLEVFLSLFVNRLCIINPNFKYNKVCIEIIEKYIRKKPDSIVSPTQIMRHVLNKK